MKSTETFKKVIEAKLQEMAKADSLFAKSLKKTNKNIDDCITYILNTVQKSDCNGFADDEIFGMAAHYYDEDKIDVGKPVNTNVVVNHHIDKAKEEAKVIPIQKAPTQTKEETRKQKLIDEYQEKVISQPTLF